MKLKNKKTGEIVDYISFGSGGSQICMYAFDTNKHYYYNSLAGLNEEWEDYEELKDKDFWFFDEEGNILDTKEENWPEESVIAAKEIGNYFETKEEAEKALEKLKAWKRLKDKRFRFTYHDYTIYKGKGCGQVFFNDDVGNINEIKTDLDLLFGGEE